MAHRHAGRIALDDDGVSVAVDDQSRQSVRFRVNQPVIGLRIKPLAQCRGAGKPAGEERNVGFDIAIRADQPAGDKRVGVVQRRAIGFPIVTDDANRGAWLDRIAGLFCDLVGEYPRMTGLQPFMASGEELKGWMHAGRLRKRAGFPNGIYEISIHCALQHNLYCGVLAGRGRCAGNPRYPFP